MKILYYIAFAFLLAGCVAPYYSVPVSGNGNYYIAERQTGGSYYRTNSLLYDDLGIHPWWMSNYPVELFSYYSPYYYPHYFSVWQPRGFYRFYGFPRWYYVYWCPPYRPRLYHEPRPADRVTASPALRPPAIVTYPDIAELRRWNDLAAVSRVATGSGVKSQRSRTWEAGSPAGSLTAFDRSPAPMARPAGIGQPTSRSGVTGSARPIAGKPRATHRQ